MKEEKDKTHPDKFLFIATFKNNDVNESASQHLYDILWMEFDEEH